MSGLRARESTSGSGRKARRTGRQGGGGLAKVVDDDDERASIAAAVDEIGSVAGGAEGEEEKTPEETMEDIVEQLSEKRSATRAIGLKRLIAQLQLVYSYDLIQSRLETLQLNLCTCIRKGDAPEVSLACHALNLTAITLGAESDRLLEQALPILTTLIRDPARSSLARSSAAECYGLLVFMAATSDQESAEHMKQLMDIVKSLGSRMSETVRAAIWQAFGLIASSLPTSMLAEGALREASLRQLIKSLSDESVDVRNTVGENIALFFEASNELEDDLAENGLEDDPRFQWAQMQYRRRRAGHALYHATGDSEEEEELEAIRQGRIDKIKREEAEEEKKKNKQKRKEEKEAYIREQRERERKQEEYEAELEAAKRAQAEEDAELTPLGEPAIPLQPSSSTTTSAAHPTEVSDESATSFSSSTLSPAFQPTKRHGPKPLKPSSRTTSSSSSAASTSSSSTSAADTSSSSSSSSSTSKEIDIEDLIDDMSSLATESSRHIGSRKERVAQKRSFRDYVKTLESGDVPVETLKVEKSRHEFVGWRQVKQLAAMRSNLSRGLNVHLVHNETLADIFDLYIEPGEGVDDPSRKAESRALSKLKERENFEHRSRQRRRKMAMMEPQELV